MNKTVIKGVSLAVLAGLCWGSMAVVAQHLMMNRGVNGEQLAVLRILGAGVLLVLFDLVSSRGQSLNDVFRKENFKDLLISKEPSFCPLTTRTLPLQLSWCSPVPYLLSDF